MNAPAPGPWIACKPGDYSDPGIIILGDDRRIALVFGVDEEAQATAQLMAASRTRSIREATSEERTEILDAWLDRFQDRSIGHAELPDHDIFVRDSYTTDCPGYSGPVAFIHWHGGPEAVDVLTFSAFGAGMAWQVATRP